MTEDTNQNIQELENSIKTNELKIQEYQQRAILGAMAVANFAPHFESSNFYLDNYVDTRDYIGGGANNLYHSTQIWDREKGRNYPIFLTESELKYIRGVGRQLADIHPIGKGVMTQVVNFTVGTGMSVRVEGIDNSAIDVDTIANIRKLVNAFIEHNDLVCDADREMCLRLHRDGDVAIGLWKERSDRVVIRFIEPDQITQPSDEQKLIDWMGYDEAPSNMLFGVHSDDDDSCNIHGYYVQWSSNGLDWDYIPGGKYPFFVDTNNNWCEFFKTNVDRQVKRGISDFFPVEMAMNLIRKVIRNTGEGAAVQASIAFIRQHAPTVTGTQILQFQAAQATDYIRSRMGDQTPYKKMDPGTVLDIPKGQTYMAGPMGVNNAEIYVQVADALARFAAVRWNMPEWMINSNIKNSNRSSGFVAEEPFLKSISVEQNVLCKYWTKVIYKVIEMLFPNIPPNIIKENIIVTISMPQISVRQPEKETIRRQILVKSGIISPATWAAEEGYSHEHELKLGAKVVDDGPAKVKVPHDRGE